MISKKEVVYTNNSYDKFNRLFTSECFLNEAKFCFLNEKFNQFTDFLNENGQSSNAYKFLCVLEEKPNADEHFEYLGIIEVMELRDKEEMHYFNLSIRKMEFNGHSWLEVTMNDITLSKNIQTIDETIKLKERILGKIAHEFKTPLLCMIGLSEDLDNHLTDKMTHEKFAQINDLSNYTLFLINDIIYFLRNNQKNIDIERLNVNEQKTLEFSVSKQPAKINEILDFTFRILQTLLKQKQKNIRIKKSNRLPDNLIIQTDPVRLKQILLNLISNAVKFTQSGLITLKCKSEGNNISISVKDTGVGIKEEDYEKLFKDFNMLNPTANMNNMGTGLGLSIAQSLCYLLGYKLSFKSVYGKGTKFTITIPNGSSTNLTMKQLSIPRSTASDTRIRSKNDANQPRLNNRKPLGSSKFYESQQHVSKCFDSEDNLSVETDRITIKLDFFHLRKYNCKESEVDFNNINNNDNIKLKNHNESIISSLCGHNHSTKAKILVIDDNVTIVNSICRLIRKILISNNIEMDIITGVDGADLIKYIIDDQRNNNLIKIVFIDEFMEYINGSEAIRVIKSLERSSKVKQVYICKISSDNEVSALGDVDIFFNKPLNEKHIEKALIYANCLKKDNDDSELI